MAPAPSRSEPERPPPRFGVLLLVRFLCGNAAAIRALVRTRQALPVAALLVLSAGLAREYDREFLPAAPQLLLLPYAASLATSFAIFTLVYLMSLGRLTPRMPFWRSYLGFLALYWLTAPLAWLYAVPYERMLDPYDAAVANLRTLEVVALWRVLLIIRVLVVLLGAPVWRIAAAVIAVSCATVLYAVSRADVPVVRLMGGIADVPAAERLIAQTTHDAAMLSFLLLGPSTLAVLVAVVRKSRPWRFTATAAARPPTPALRTLVVVALVGWIPALVTTQPEQWNRRRVERQIGDGQIDAAFAFLMRHDRDDFPPHWRPPPRYAYRSAGPTLEHIAERLATGAQLPEWAREAYVTSILHEFLSGFGRYDDPPTVRQAELLCALIERYPKLRDRCLARIPSVPRHLLDDDGVRRMRACLEIPAGD